MIITKTPFRMSFFGGGTDYEAFFRKYGGSVISTTFDKYCYVTVRHQPQFFDYENQITYGKIERTKNVDDIEHPMVRNAMKMLDMHELRITYDADLPARSGLGSSSAFAVGLLNGFYALKGKKRSKEFLAEKAIYVERELCRESGGWQDQVAVAVGGLNRIDFHDRSFTVRPLDIPDDYRQMLNSHLMLFFTGFSRFSSEIAEEQAKATETKRQDLSEMLRLVDVCEDILLGQKDVHEFGRLLDYTWKLKRGLTGRISTEAIDTVYEKAKKAGAVGGKLLGAGGGGFIVLFVDPDKQMQVKRALSSLMYIPFKFEDSGTQILYYVPEIWPCGEEESFARLV